MENKTKNQEVKEQETRQIKYFYIVLNGGVNLATPNKERALKRISELYDLMQLNKNKDWEISLSYGA